MQGYDSADVKKGFSSISYKISFVVAITIILLSCVTGVFSYSMYRKECIEKYARIALATAQSAAAAIDVDEFQETMKSGKKTDYQQASKEIFEKIKTATGVEFVYAVAQEVNGEYPYYATAFFDVEVGHVQGTEFFANEIADPFITGLPAVSRVYDAGEDEYSQYGYLISGYAPLKNEDGKTVGVVGVDIKVDQAFTDANIFGVKVLLFIVVITIVFIIITNITNTKLIFAPFGKLMNSISRVKANVNEHIYGTNRHDEIGDLANTIQNMKDGLIDALGKVHYDALTGLYNRRFLEEELNRIIKSSSRSGGKLSVMFMDVDFFKKYNDVYGHNSGDNCLRFIATAIMNSTTRDDDIVARYGGEEFVVVLPNTDKNGACVIADRVLENVRACNIPHEKNDAATCVTISIGVTTGGANYMLNGEDYLKRADEALYISKNNGRNKYTFLDFEEATT